MIIILTGCAIKYEPPIITKIYSQSSIDAPEPAVLSSLHAGLSVMTIDGKLISDNLVTPGNILYVAPGHHLLEISVRSSTYSSSYYGNFEADVELLPGHFYEIANLSTDYTKASLHLIDKGISFEPDCIYFRRLVYAFAPEMVKCIDRYVDASGKLVPYYLAVEKTDVISKLHLRKIDKLF